MYKLPISSSPSRSIIINHIILSKNESLSPAKNLSQIQSIIQSMRSHKYLPLFLTQRLLYVSQKNFKIPFAQTRKPFFIQAVLLASLFSEVPITC